MYCCGFIYTITDRSGILWFPTFHIHTQGDAEIIGKYLQEYESSDIYNKNHFYNIYR